MSDLISREDAIKAIESWEWQELYLPIHFKQVLEELPSAKQWIPVSERLPEKDERVLTFGADDYGNTGIYISKLYGYSTEEKQFFLGYTGTMKVKAWMPLPEPWGG